MPCWDGQAPFPPSLAPIGAGFRLTLRISYEHLHGLATCNLRNSGLRLGRPPVEASVSYATSEVGGFRHWSTIRAWPSIAPSHVTRTPHSPLRTVASPKPLVQRSDPDPTASTERPRFGGVFLCRAFEVQPQAALVRINAHICHSSSRVVRPDAESSVRAVRLSPWRWHFSTCVSVLT